MTLAADAVKDGLREKRVHDPRKSAPFLWGREHLPRGSLGPYDGCRSASKRLPGRFSRFARLTMCQKQTTERVICVPIGRI